MDALESAELMTLGDVEASLSADIDGDEHPTRASSPDTSSSDPGNARGNATLVKRPWTPEEDVALVAAVHKYGACRWSMIATQLSTGRVGKQCRERWNNHLCPEVKKTEWSEVEDRAILQGVAVLGTRWCEIVKTPPLSGRTDNAIKNRFYSLQRRMKARQCGGNRARRGRDTDEDEPVPGQTDRIMSIATELAFATDESERDRLIEELTVTLHEGGGPPGLDDDLASDIDGIHSPNTLSQLEGLSSEIDYGFEPTDGERVMPPPPPLKPGRKRSSSARSVSVSEETDLMSVAAALRPQDSDAAFLLSDGSVPSEVCAVADLLDLPLSPRRDAACIDSLSDLTFCPDGPKRRPSSPADHIPTAAKLNSDPDSGAMDLLTDASSTTSTVSPDCIGGATTHCENAWPRDPDLVLDPSACELPDPCDVGMADACGVEEADRRALALQPSSIHECGTEVDRRHAADDERSSRAAETSVPTTPVDNANGCSLTTMRANENVSAACLGGRHAYKAFLAPLRLPVEQLSDADSPKRLRTPNGAVVAAGSARSNRRHRGLDGALRAHVATGTKEPGTMRNIAAPNAPAASEHASECASELLSFDLFNDLFTDEANTGEDLSARSERAPLEATPTGMTAVGTPTPTASSVTTSSETAPGGCSWLAATSELKRSAESSVVVSTRAPSAARSPGCAPPPTKLACPTAASTTGTPRRSQRHCEPDGVRSAYAPSPA